jgi:hypothetical protein
MKELSKYLLGFLIAGILIVIFYFVIYQPALESEYKRGLSQCEKDTDTLYVPGKDSIVYRDTSFSTNKPVQIKDNDSLLTFTTSFDTSFVSGKDTITNKAEIKIKVKKENDKWDLKNVFSKWFMNYEHKDFTQQPDTMKIYFPKYIEIPIKETNWLITSIAYASGVLSAIVIFLIAR